MASNNGFRLNGGEINFPYKINYLSKNLGRFLNCVDKNTGGTKL